MSINRNHSRTDCKNSLEMSILRSVFEGDINCDCIFTRFFASHLDNGDSGDKNPNKSQSLSNGMQK